MLLFEHDLSILLGSIERVVKSKEGSRRLIFVEIGLNKGGTAEALIAKIASLIGVEAFDYYGIDPVEHRGIYPLVKVINKRSSEAINDVPFVLDWVFVDGCHCSNCVINDLILYGSRLREDGEICFHDASPSTQGRDPQDYPFMNHHHVVEIAKRGIAVRAVLDKIVKKMNTYELVAPSLDQKLGGVEIYKATKSSEIYERK